MDVISGLAVLVLSGQVHKHANIVRHARFASISELETSPNIILDPCHKTIRSHNSNTERTEHIKITVVSSSSEN
eukprot:408212-Amphidinium_carterae.1